MHIWSLENIYIGHIYIYIFHVYMFLFVNFVCCICANGCKLVQMHASLHITSDLVCWDNLRILESSRLD